MKLCLCCQRSWTCTMDKGKRNLTPIPPDGGWGWMIVVACFLTTFFARGITRCISVFFVEFQMQFSQDYSRTAWIHSLVDCTTMLCAPLGSLIGARLSHRIAAILGGVLATIGFVFSSFATTMEHLYLSLGIITGMGFALSYTPAVAMVGIYFRERTALAYGIAMSGSGIGTFLLAPVVQLLIEYYTWRGALLIVGGLLSHLCVCGALMKPLDEREIGSGQLETRFTEVLQANEADAAEPANVALQNERPADPLPANGPSKSFQNHAHQLCPPLKADFLLLSLSFFFLACGCTVPFVYLVPYALGVGLSNQQAAILMSILGVTDIVGNITFGWLADRKCWRPCRLASYMLAVGLEGLSCLLVPVLQGFPGLLAFVLLYGYFDGAYVALIPVVTSDIVGPAYLSSALGLVYFLHAVPYLISPPIGGWLLDTTGSYTAVFFLSGSCLMSSSVALAILALHRSRVKPAHL
ncbi:monocarboxylate transporter 12-B-like isoform X2 [Denticeps clupeoides]|uniref:monocarboxylate transporter 12-B-like isoform X2 n=1 Tax=Denticeps clupeoides TaxID=299321 RepID=UPI0010A2BB19|nr:monocarboxylate transporter 12-B-like isoform X2 [Denticeps clupeoides]XP_028844901.1 monocarboxylate transporter 12-B-like isoform X2 [Denticeps clupeoides]